MEINYLAVAFWVLAFAVTIVATKYPLGKINWIYTILAVLCASLYVLLMTMGGASLLDTALGMAVLCGGVLLLYEQEERAYAV